MTTNNWREEKEQIEVIVADNLVQVPVEFPNGEKTQPENTEDDGHWIRLTIRPGDNNRISLGNNPLRRRVGLVIFQIFCPTKVGTKYADELVDTIMDLFQDREYLIQAGSKILFRSVSVDVVGCPMGQEQFQINVEIPYWRDKIG